MEAFDSVRELIALAFGVPRETVTPQTAQADIPAWDSVGHLNLMLMLEDQFKVRLDVSDMVTLTSVEAILDWLTKRGRESFSVA
jgi:acyl carrier protein